MRIPLALLLSMLAAPAWAIDSPREMVEKMIEKAASGPGRIVDLQGFDIDWPLNARATRVTIADEQGVWLSIDQPKIDWQPQALLRHRRVEISRIAADLVRLERLPEAGEQQPAAGSGDGMAVRIGRIEAPVQLGEAVVGVALSGKVEGNLALAAEQAGQLRLSLDAGTHGQFAWDPALLAADLRKVGEDLRIEGGLQGRLTRAPADLAGPLSADFAATARGEVIEIAELVLRSPAGRLRASGRIAGERLDLTAQARMPDLARLRPLIGQPVAGSASGWVHVAGTFSAPRAGFTLRSRNFQGGPPEAAPWLGDSPTLAGTVTWPRVALRLEGVDATATAIGSVQPDLSLLWALDADRLDRWPLAGWQGRLAAQGLAAGRMDDPQVIGSAEVTREAANDLPALSGRADFAMLDQAGSLFADIDAGALSAQARTGFAYGERLRLTDLSVTGPGTRVSGDLAIDLAGPAADGTLRGRVADLAPWGRILGTPMAGGLDFDMALASADGQRLKLDLQGRGLQAAGVSLPRLTANADLSRLLTAPQGRATVDVQGLSAPGVQVATANLTARGGADGMRLQIEVAGERRREFRLVAAGLARMSPDRQSLDLQRMTLRYGPEKLSLVAPATITRGPQGIALAETQLTTGQGRIVASGRLDQRKIAGKLSLQDVPLAVAQVIAPNQRLDGRVDGEATIAGTLDAPVIDARLAGRGIDLAGQRADIAANLEAHLRDQRLEFRADAAGAGGFALDGSGRVVLNGGPISGRLALQGDLARLAEYLPITGQRFAGRLAADMAVAGTMAEPRLTGTASVQNGQFENFDTGTVLTEVSLTATADQSRRAALRASGRGAQGGRFSGDGELWFDEVGLRYALDVALDRLPVLATDFATGEATGGLRLAGDDVEGRVTGALELREVAIELERPLPADVVTLEVREINKPGQRRPKPGERQEENSDPAMVLALDVKLAVPRAVVRGRGLDSDWRGDLRLAGTADDPRITGEMKAIRGSYDLLGRSFALADTSTVAFQGDTNPSLDIAAEAQTAEVRARVRVEGSAKQPSVRFESDPQLPSDEVLSRLIFGRTPGQLSPFQQIELARAAASLARGGTGDGFDPLGRIQQALGLDQLQAGGGDEGGVGVSAGKYLNDRTLLRVEQTAEGSDVTLEYELGRGVNVTTGVGQQQGGSVGLNWRRDY